jgi:uncharacterized protein (TIGR03067 family)
MSALALLVSAWAPAQADDEATRKDLRLLRGTWVPVGLATADGQKPLTATRVEKVVIAGDKWVMHEQGRRYEYSFTVDPTARPKAMEMTGTFDGQASRSLCIYEVTADRLRFANGAGQRPAGFDKLPPGGVLFEFRRARD